VLSINPGTLVLRRRQLGAPGEIQMNLKFAAPLLLALASAGCNREPAPASIDVKALMAEHVQPTAVIYWGSVQYISDESGSRKIEPRTDTEWTRTQDAASKLREYALQLKSPAAATGKGTDWMDYAQGLADVATQAEQVANERNPDKVFQVGGSLYNVCSACHETYGGTAPTGVESAATTTVQ
jgi:hypothetical protein